LERVSAKSSDMWEVITIDIWLSRCNKGATCDYCHEPIEVGEPEIYGKIWRQYGGDKPRKWVKVLHWHGKRKADGLCCWLQQALEHLALNPHIETRGRKKIVMPKEMRLKRLRLLQRRAKVIAGIRAELEQPKSKRDINVIARMGEKLEKLKVEIAEVGGVPKSWG
jgi:hypothetical protein